MSNEQSKASNAYQTQLLKKKLDNCLFFLNGDEEDEFKFENLILSRFPDTDDDEVRIALFDYYRQEFFDNEEIYKKLIDAWHSSKA